MNIIFVLLLIKETTYILSLLIFFSLRCLNTFAVPSLILAKLYQALGQIISLRQDIELQ